MIWFENHSGRLALVDLGPNYYEISRKEGDVPTCLCPQLDPGHYMGILNVTNRGYLRLEIDIVAGQIWHWPIIDHTVTGGEILKPQLISE
jgi:hypothetical protein